MAYWIKEAFDYYHNYLKDCDEKTKTLLKENFQGYEFLIQFSVDFYRDCKIINEILEIIKNRGLSKETFNKSISILSQLSLTSMVRIKLENYLMENLHKLENNKISNLLLSTDIIESIFGKIKYILNRSPVNDFNKLSLILPGLVGFCEEELIIKALKEVKIKDMVAERVEVLKNGKMKILMKLC